MKCLPPLVLGLLVIGCQQKPAGYVPKPTEAPNPVSVTKDTETTLMPFRVGNQWTYLMTRTQTAENGTPQSGEASVVYRITSVKTENGKTTAELVFTVDGALADKQVWSSDDKGIYQVSVGAEKTIPFSPPQPSVLFPMTEHAKFNWSGTGLCPNGEVGSLTIESEVGAQQTVDTDQGKMSAIPIMNKVKFKAKRSGHSISTTWFQPGFGIARYYEETYVDAGPNKATEPSTQTTTTLRLRNSALKQQ